MSNTPQIPESETVSTSQPVQQWLVKLSGQEGEKIRKAGKNVLSFGLKINPEVLACPFGSDDWKPLKEWFPEECDAIVSASRLQSVEEKDIVGTESSESESTVLEPAAPEPILPDSILLELRALQEKIDSLSNEISFSTKFAEKKQEQIDKLYEENRLYKDGIIERFKEKLVMGIIEQLSQADRQIQNFEKKEETEKNYKNLLETFRELTDDFREMLSNRFNVDTYHSEAGDTFDAKKHQVLPNGFVSTNDEAKKDTVVSSERSGYVIASKILRQEIVKIYRYQAAIISPPADVPLSEEPASPTTQET